MGFLIDLKIALPLFWDKSLRALIMFWAAIPGVSDDTEISLFRTATVCRTQAVAVDSPHACCLSG
jgi:hypothetical protein